MSSRNDLHYGTPPLSTSIDDNLFEINQTGLSAMWIDSYPPSPSPLILPTAPLPVPVAYDIIQQEQPSVQATIPGPILVQRGVSQNSLVNNRPARWIPVMDVNPSYQRPRTPSPHRAPALSIYVRAPEVETHYRAVFLRELTVQEAIARVVQKYGFSDDERERVRMAVRITDHGARRLTDADVRLMESEVAIEVKVTRWSARSEDWLLQLRY